MNREDWSFLSDEAKKSEQTTNNLYGTSITLMLTRDEYKSFMRMRQQEQLSAPQLVKQAIRLYELYKAGRLAPVLDDLPGGCAGE
jgi:hypothetical protein